MIGGGASGAMAAIAAAGRERSVCLIERNDSIGRKMLLTGKGRCNITNTASIDTFISKFNPKGEFYRTAFFSFSNEDLMEFFRSRGLELKAERQGRVFPSTNRAASVVSVLEGCLKEKGVNVILNERAVGIEGRDNTFTIVCESGGRIKSKKIIISTGGASYKATGSTGDGFTLAKSLGHEIASLKPALVPLKTKEAWVKDLQGLGLENVRVTFHCGKKKIASEIGEVMFTHFGVSGPLILDLSGDVVSALEKIKEIKMTIDLKPGMRDEQLSSRLINKFAVKGNCQMKTLMQDLLPKRMVDVFLSILNITLSKKTNQITKDERRAIIDTLKAFPLTIIGSLPIEEAMVTGGGVSRLEIDPRTMESRKARGVYFAGEAIEGAAPSGGYNLQQAFSTGHLAGMSAAAG